jgi:hypothetical protein
VWDALVGECGVFCCVVLPDGAAAGGVRLYTRALADYCGCFNIALPWSGKGKEFNDILYSFFVIFRHRYGCGSDSMDRFADLQGKYFQIFLFGLAG